MGAKKMLVKGLALGAVLGAVAAMIHEMKDRDISSKEVTGAAERIKNKVSKHAMKLGKLTKEAYGSIVDTTVGEYRGVKALTEDELKDLSKELKGSWKEVQAMMMKPKKSASKSAAKKRA
jgi:hypothetical protein